MRQRVGGYRRESHIRIHRNGKLNNFAAVGGDRGRTLRDDGVWTGPIGCLLERVLSIFLPTWDVNLLQRKSKRTAGTKPRRGLLLVTHQAQQQVVARCCHVARAAGVSPGMT